MYKIPLIIVLLLLSTACSNKTKKSLGLIDTLPDEYQVSRNKALEIPPHFKYTSNNTAVLRSHPSKDANNKLSVSEKALLREVK